MTDLFGVYTQIVLAKFSLQDFTFVAILSKKTKNHWILEKISETVRHFCSFSMIRIRSIIRRYWNVKEWC